MSSPNSRKAVLVVTDSRGGPTATQRISFESPFSDGGASDRYQISFETEHSDQIAIATALASQSPDLVVLSRYTSLTGMEWIAQARKAGIPVVFHIDDDLLAVPASLGDAKFNKYNDPARIAALRENIEHSDLCYVSTHELAKRFKEHGVATAIVSGEIYCSVSPDEVGALVPPATGPVIGYMGTAGHSADLEMILPDIAAAMELLPTLNFELFGSVKMPPELTRFGRRVRHLPAVADYGQFRARLRSLGWWVGLAPLEDNAFNRCKADTKWVEYSLAGAAVIASDLVVYRHACADGAGVLAKSAGEWAEAILGLIYRPGDRASMIEAAQQKLRERYSHERLRQQVVAIFDRAFATTAKAARSAVTRRRASPFPGEWLPRAD